MSDVSYLDALYRPKHILIAGFSPDPKKAGVRFLAALKAQGYAGTISLLGRSAGNHGSLTIYADAATIPANVDLVFNMYPAKATLEMLPEIAARGAKLAVVFTSGFAEQDADLAAAQARMVEACRAKGMRIVGPNCPGYFYLPSNISLIGQSGLPVGPVALVSQSGNVGITLWDQARMLDLGWSAFIGVGNQSDIPLYDHIAYLGEDPNTEVIALYLEGLPQGQGAAFRDVCQRVTRKKPIVALKGGRTPEGRRAAQSHTASLSSEAATYSALFEESGIIEVNHLEHLLPLAEVLYRCPPMKGDRVAIVGSGGGHSIVGTDEVQLAGLEVPEFNAELQQAAAARLPVYAPRRNPLDMTGGFTKDPSLFAQFTQMVIDHDHSYHGFLNYGLYGLYRGGRLEEGHVHTYESAAPLLGAIQSKTGLPIIFYTPYAYQRHTSFTALREAGVPCFADLNLAALGLAALRRRGRYLESEPGAAVTASEPNTSRGAARPQSEAEAAQVLQSFGVRFPRSEIAHSAEDAPLAAETIGFPVVLKGILPGVPHKSDLGAVKLGLSDRQMVARAAQDIERSVSAKLGQNKMTGYLVVQDLGRPREFFVGVRKDFTCGLIGVVGLGGVYAEAIADTNVCILPASAQSVGLSIGKLRSKSMWGDFRGEPGLDHEAIADLLNRLASALEAHPDCTAIECNPVMVVGRDLIAVDAAFDYPESTDT